MRPRQRVDASAKDVPQRLRTGRAAESDNALDHRHQVVRAVVDFAREEPDPFLAVLLVGDVHGDAHDAGRLALLIEQGFGPRVEPADLPVGAPKAVLDLEVPLSAFAGRVGGRRDALELAGKIVLPEIGHGRTRVQRKPDQPVEIWTGFDGAFRSDPPGGHAAGAQRHLQSLLGLPDRLVGEPAVRDVDQGPDIAGRLGAAVRPRLEHRSLTRAWQARVNLGLATRRSCWFDDRMSATPRTRPSTDDDLLDDLRQLLAARGKLSSSLIEASEITRTPNTYIRRFGSLIAAYARIGYEASARQRAASARFKAQSPSTGPTAINASAPSVGRGGRPEPATLSPPPGSPR
nr:hypothetical protein [Phenylobacterium sp.]